MTYKLSLSFEIVHAVDRREMRLIHFQFNIIHSI